LLTVLAFSSGHYSVRLPLYMAGSCSALPKKRKQSAPTPSTSTEQRNHCGSAAARLESAAWYSCSRAFRRCWELISPGPPAKGIGLYITPIREPMRLGSDSSHLTHRGCRRCRSVTGLADLVGDYRNSISGKGYSAPLPDRFAVRRHTRRRLILPSSLFWARRFRTWRGLDLISSLPFRASFWPPFCDVSFW